MPINWKDPATFERLLVAWYVVAGRPDYRKMADAFGEDATYDALESHFRRYKTRAEARKMEMETGTPNSSTGQAATPKTSNKRTKSGSGSRLSKNGRVQKPKKSTPKATPSKTKLEKESEEEEEEKVEEEEDYDDDLLHLV